VPRTLTAEELNVIRYSLVDRTNKALRELAAASLDGNVPKVKASLREYDMTRDIIGALGHSPIVVTIS
jgi:hypothetical protein